MANDWYGQQQRNNNNLMTMPVQGEEAAQNYMVAAGRTVLLIDLNSKDKRLWLKSNDSDGLIQTIRTFKVEEITPQQKPNGDFVSQTEFAELKNQLNNQFNQIAASLNSLLNRGEISNATNNGQSAGVSAEVQRVCEQLSAKSQGNNAPANGSKPA